VAGDAAARSRIETRIVAIKRDAEIRTLRTHARFARERAEFEQARAYEERAAALEAPPRFPATAPPATPRRVTAPSSPPAARGSAGR
jgi:hypothetical protein